MSNAVGVIGAGGWGTAIAKVLAAKGDQVVLWCHGEDTYRGIVTTRENRLYLPGIKLPSSVYASQSLNETIANKALVVCAVPSHVVRPVIAEIASSLPDSPAP